MIKEITATLITSVRRFFIERSVKRRLAARRTQMLKTVQQKRAILNARNQEKAYVMGEKRSETPIDTDRQELLNREENAFENEFFNEERRFLEEEIEINRLSKFADNLEVHPSAHGRRESTAGLLNDSRARQSMGGVNTSRDKSFDSKNNNMFIALDRLESKRQESRRAEQPKQIVDDSMP